MTVKVTQLHQIPTLYDQYSVYRKIFSKISIWKGDITKLEIEGIVNPANPAFLGDCDGCAEGGVNQAIHQAAGLTELQKECRKRAYNIGPGNVIMTPRCKMSNIRRIIHAIGPKCKNPIPTEEEIVLLKKCYTTALWQLTQIDLHTIAFCPISTGPIYGYPNDDAAYTAGNAIVHFLKNHPRGNWIHRVVFCVSLPEDEKYYKEYFEELAKKYKHTRVIKLHELPTLYVKYQVCKKVFDKISIWNGDITKVEVDIVVCPTKEDLHGGADEVGIAILEAAGSSEMKREFGKLLHCCSIGEIAFTPSHNMDHVKEIVHAAGPQCKDKVPTDEEIKLLKNCYRNALEMSVNKSYSTIAFCPISTGSNGFPNDDAAYTAGNSILSFLKAAKNADHIERIVICTPRAEDEKYYYEYFSELAEKYKKTE